MPRYTVMAYNVEFMNDMFTNSAVEPGAVQRAEAIAEVIDRIDPDVLAISEAANEVAEHQDFIARFLGGRFRVVAGRSRGRQNLVFYYRAPFEVESVDEDIDYYEPFNTDVDGDKVTERIRWERKPLEVVFRVGGAGAPRMRFILLHTKSKGIFDVVDLAGFQSIALGNRKKLIGQASRLRARLDRLLSEGGSLPTIVLGDLNDGPGIDPFEKRLGMSFVETVMGSVFAPELVLHNALYHTSATAAGRAQLYTADFPDPIVSHPRGFRHQVWIDHILLSPDLRTATSPIRYVEASGAIDEKDRTSRDASDHFAVYCEIED